jgi:hypothetical protein
MGIMHAIKIQPNAHFFITAFDDQKGCEYNRPTCMDMKYQREYRDEKQSELLGTFMVSTWADPRFEPDTKRQQTCLGLCIFIDRM